MKKIYVLVMALFFVSVILTSCNKGSDALTPVTATDNSASEMVVSYSAVASESNDPDLQTEISAKPMSEVTKYIKLTEIFQRLKLTAEQKAQVKIFMDQQRECTELAMKTLRDSEKEIIKNGNIQRKAIMQQLKDSSITKETARILLKTLGETTRLALKNNPAREVAELAMKACKETFAANISGILTTEQLVKWNKFLENNASIMG